MTKETQNMGHLDNEELIKHVYHNEDKNSYSRHDVIRMLDYLFYKSYGFKK